MIAQSDITFIKSYKKESLTLTFIKVNLAIKNVNRKLKLRIARIYWKVKWKTSITKRRS